MYRYDDNFGWTHRYLTIREQGALLALNDLPAVTRETIARYLILQHTSLERQQKLFYCRESFLKQEYKLRLTPTELLELSLSLLASGKLEGDSKSVTQIGTVRFLADCLGLDFPANYDSLMYQLKEREQLTKFMDELVDCKLLRMNRGDIGENYVAVHYDNDYTCRIFLYYYYSSRMTTVIAIQSLRIWPE